MYASISALAELFQPETIVFAQRSGVVDDRIEPAQERVVRAAQRVRPVRAGEHRTIGQLEIIVGRRQTPVGADQRAARRQAARTGEGLHPRRGARVGQAGVGQGRDRDFLLRPAAAVEQLATPMADIAAQLHRIGSRTVRWRCFRPRLAGTVRFGRWRKQPQRTDDAEGGEQAAAAEADHHAAQGGPAARLERATLRRAAHQRGLADVALAIVAFVTCHATATNTGWLMHHFGRATVAAPRSARHVHSDLAYIAFGPALVEALLFLLRKGEERPFDKLGANGIQESVPMSTYAARLAALRDQLKRDRLDGFVVPLTDEHMSEYVGAYAQRLAWLTGFQGSAGSAVVLPEEAAIFTDGRYTLQVREQVDGANWAYVDVPATSVASWLGDHAPQGGRIGYDPWLHTRAWVEEATKALAERGATLVPVDTNPVDAVWPDRPAPSDALLSVQDDARAGKSSAEKRAAIADWLAERKADAVVLTARDRSEFAGARGRYAGKRVAVDPERAVAAIFDARDGGGATILSLRDPTVLAKAMKNPAEIAGHKAASARDGAALVRFLRWVEPEAPKGGLTELSCVARLQEFREATGVLKDTSFDTISATGAHGASSTWSIRAGNMPTAPPM